MNDGSWRRDYGRTHRTGGNLRDYSRLSQHNFADHTSPRQYSSVENGGALCPLLDWNPHQNLQDLRQQSNFGTIDGLMWPSNADAEASDYAMNIFHASQPAVTDSSWTLNSSAITPSYTQSMGTFPKDQVITDRKSDDRFGTVNASTRAFESRNGRLVVKLENGIEVAAILHRDRYLDHQKLNQTTYKETTTALRMWDVDENGTQPVITYHADETNDARSRVLSGSSYIPWKDSKGRIVVNSDKKPLRASIHLPETVSTKIEGWRMELIMRLDSSVTSEDFLDRMPDASCLFSKTCASSLQSRRRKDKNIFEFRARTTSGTSSVSRASHRQAFREKG